LLCKAKGLRRAPVRRPLKGKSLWKEEVVDETNLEDKLNELVREFGEPLDPQRIKLAELAKQAQANRKQLEKSINRLQELLDYLRVCIKYQVFDLEATRRENEYLRKLLEESTS
jgi:ATP phosphoribosyltransferase regulatory subunit HisZ